MKVPFREIALASSSEAVGQNSVFRVYDTSGPYTDAEPHIDVNQGLSLCALSGSQRAPPSRSMAGIR